MAAKSKQLLIIAALSVCVIVLLIRDFRRETPSKENATRASEPAPPTPLPSSDPGSRKSIDAPNPVGEETPIANAPLHSPDHSHPIFGVAPTFLSELPDLPGLEAALDALADLAIIDVKSFELDRLGGKAEITFSGNDLTGTIRKSPETDQCLVWIRSPLNDPSLPSQFSKFQVSSSFDYRDNVASSVQTELRFEPLPPRKEDGEVGWARFAAIPPDGIRVGYQVRYGPNGLDVIPWRMRIIEDPRNGKGLSSEMLMKSKFTLASHPSRAYDKWGDLILKTWQKAAALASK